MSWPPVPRRHDRAAHATRMLYADFCPVVRLSYDNLSRRNDTEQISRGKLSCLPCTIAESTLRTLGGYGTRSKLPARPVLAPNIRFFVHRLARLTMRLRTPPRGDSPFIITGPSPPSGWSEDFHLRTAEHARHTTK